VTPERLAAVASVEQMEEIYAKAVDDEEKSMVVCRWLEVDLRSGVGAAIEFLSGDPPLLFRLAVVDKLKEVTGREVQYDITKLFTSPSNQEAVADLKRTVGSE